MRFSEAEEDRELFDLLFRDIDTSASGAISHAELAAAVGKHHMQQELRDILESLLSGGGTAAGQDSITREAFGRAFETLPRVRGERVKWARGLRLEEQVALLLPRGDIFDGLKGLRALPESELPALAQSVAAQLAAVLPDILMQELAKLRSADVAPSAAGAALRHVNTKFSLDGAFVGRYATLDDFYHGPEALIGAPNPRIEEGMATEHCRRENKDVRFTTSNYNVETWPSLEWEFVVHPRPGVAYPHTPSDRSKWKPEQVWTPANTGGWKGEHGRDPIGVTLFFEEECCEEEEEEEEGLTALPAGVTERLLRARAVIAKAGLLRGEVIGLRLYTGPLFAAYNAVLRGFPESDVAMLRGNRYETTIFAITSGITKVSKITDLPVDRLLYRGLGGQILPRQFWDAYDECTVTLLVSARAGEPTQAVLDAVRKLLCKPRPAASGAAATQAYDVSVEYLQLPHDRVPAALREAVAKGIRVVREPREAGAAVSLAVAVVEVKFQFEQHLSREFSNAISAACDGRTVAIAHIAAKPHSFRGGVEFGLMSTTTDKRTAFAYSGVSKQRGIVFEITAGRVDVGASISFLSQYPGEEEFLMPPLSCLEVVGEQRVDRTDDGEVVVVPLRINVNLKSATVEDLIGRRKVLHSTMVKNLREELEYELQATVDAYKAMADGRRRFVLEVLRGSPAAIDPDTCSVEFGLPSLCGAEFLAAGGGARGARGYYYEVEVLQAEGYLRVGFAGTSLGPQCQDVGGDVSAWGFNMGRGSGQHGGKQKFALLAGFERAGAMVGVAWDASNAALLVAVDGAPLAPLFSDGVAPGPVVGAGLFPALSGYGGCRVAVNLGQRPFRHPPPPEFLPCAATAPVQAAQAVIPGAGVEELLAAFDAVRAEHGGMAAEKFNDDGIYKAGINKALDIKAAIATKQALLIQLWREGGAAHQLRVVASAQAADFVGTRRLEEDWQGYTWRSALSTGFFGRLAEVPIPLNMAPCEIALVWMAVLEAEAKRVKLGADTVLDVADVVPVLRLKDRGLHLAKFESAVTGLALASLHAGVGGVLSELDLRGMEFKVTDALRAAIDELHRGGTLRRAVHFDVAQDAQGGKTLKDCVTDADGRAGVALGERLKAAWEWDAVLGQVEAYGWATLKLSTEAIDASGATSLAPSLARLTQLQKLDLNMNEIGAAGAASLAPSLARLTQLQHLSLENNVINAKGAASLAPSLACLVQLKELFLGYNGFGAEGAASLAPSLACLTQLQHLHLKGNGINGAAAAELRAGLSHISTLEL